MYLNPVCRYFCTFFFKKKYRRNRTKMHEHYKLFRCGLKVPTRP